MFAGSADGKYVARWFYTNPIMYIYDEEWIKGGPINAVYDFTKSGWFDGDTFKLWFFK